MGKKQQEKKIKLLTQYFRYMANLWIEKEKNKRKKNE